MESIVHGSKPLGDVNAICKQGRVSPPCAGAIEVVRRIEPDSRRCEQRGKSRCPEISVTARAMQEEDGWTALHSALRAVSLLCVHADSDPAALEEKCIGHSGLDAKRREVCSHLCRT